jgi:acetyltransferase-like isoleucine patch superfamily enzyme
MYVALAYLFRKGIAGRDKLATFLIQNILRARGVRVGISCSFFGNPIIGLHQGSSISIGKHCSFISRPSMTALGTAHPVILRTLLPGASIVIGDDSGLSGCSICAAQRISIGKGVLLGAEAIIVDTDFHPVYPNRRRAPLANAASAAVCIEDDVFIGARVIVLKGVTIGQGSVVGAGAVVTRSFPPMSVLAGNPAKVIGTVPNSPLEGG